MDLVVCEKEIYLYGKKETHKILCIRLVSLDGNFYIKPLTYASKGNDGYYYHNYVVLDYFNDNETLLKL